MLLRALREECQVVCQEVWEVSLEECQEVWVDSQEVLQEANKDLKLMKLIDYLILYCNHFK
jgi:hypothetical protein